MNERLILMIKQPSEPLRNSAIIPNNRTTEVTESHRGLLWRLCASLCALWCFPAFAQPVWEQLPPLPEPNGGFACGYVYEGIIVIGGTNWRDGKKQWLNKVHIFEPETKRWQEAKPLQSAAAYGVNLQLDESHFGFWGGSDGQKPIRSLVPVAEKGAVWLSMPELPETVVLAAGGSVGQDQHNLLVGGTNDAANLAGLSRSTYVFGSAGMVRLADYPGKPFATAASAVVVEELFVFGGMNYDAEAKLPVNSSEAYAFSPDKNVWRKLTPLAVPTRGLTAVTLDESHIYIAGGYREDFTAEAVIYDVKADSYRKALPLPYAAMVGLVKMGDHVYCLGGEDKKQSRTDKFFRIPVVELLK
ncbi:MAG: Kelch repeat-containing protein [Prosthecobacter sp.]|jgi:N-acetylneuraminic acid mutarotase